MVLQYFRRVEEDVVVYTYCVLIDGDWRVLQARFRKRRGRWEASIPETWGSKKG